MGKRIKIYDLAKKMFKIANPIKYSEEYFKSIIQIIEFYFAHDIL